MNITHLRVNHRKKPFIDTAPEFSWRIESDRNNVLQKAYRIEIFADGEKVFDSQKILSDCQSFVKAYGFCMRSKTLYSWRVTVWDNEDVSASAESAFETAFLSQDEWQAQWVESTVERNEAKMFTYGIENPAVLFKRAATVGANIAKARLYATAYGCYRVYINGKRPDLRELAPEFTPYDKILNYQVYDVTDMLNSGENSIEFLVGDGWYFCEQTAVVTEARKPAPSVLYRLEVDFEDGTHKIVASDGSETCEASKIVFSDLFMGEKHDMTLPQAKKLQPAVRDYGYKNLRVQPTDAISAVEEFRPQRIFTAPNGDKIIDFGQVIAGKTVVNVDEPLGTEITLEHTEVLDKDGNYFDAMVAKQKDTYISDGHPGVFDPAFTFHAFRYVRVTGISDIRAENFKAVLLSTPKENAASFACDDKRFERLYKNIRYSQKNNMMSVPTDCPGREKAGWTGDILIYAETAMLNEEMTPFLSSWIDGLCADQQTDGVIPLISPFTKLYETVGKQTMAPFGDTELTGIAGWSDAVIWVPYDMYTVTGNREILRRTYPAMKKWCEYIIKTARDKRGSDNPEDIDRYLWNTGFHFGEWLVPGRTGEGFEICKESAFYIAPYFGFWSLKLMADIQELLGEDSTYFRQTAEKMKQAITDGIFKRNLLPDYLMGAYVLAFAFDLVPSELKKEYADRLAALVEKNDRRLGTGFLATPFLLPVLDKIGRHDLSAAILRQTQCPSWLFEVEHGATAIWENWESYEQDGQPKRTSFDHYAFGCVDSYILHTVCGIKSAEPGYKRIIIEPDETDIFGSFKRSFVCEAGEISVEKHGNTLKVKIPCNTRATVIFGGSKTEIGSGSYTFEK